MPSVGQRSFACLGRHGGVCSCVESSMMKLGDGRFLSGRVISIRRLGSGTVSAIYYQEQLGETSLSELF
jgi:hypothetical protein